MASYTSPAYTPGDTDGTTRRFAGCSKIQDYEPQGKLGEGTFGMVYKALSKKTGQVVALKKILMHNEKDGFPITALREIKLLKQLDHINILKLEEMAVERSKDVKKKPAMYMVTPYMDHDLSGLLENPDVHFTEPQIKCYMRQLLEGTKYLHENQILHRDMKAANLLINNKGILQIADFGLARPYFDPPPVAGHGGGEAENDYTTLVVTRWYRPPELLLQLRKYTTAIDMWGVGCVFGEMFKGTPILAGNSDTNQAVRIFELVGSPTEENMPGWQDLPGLPDPIDFRGHRGNLDQVFSDQGPTTISLLREMLRLDWRTRINAIDALNHPYFKTKPYPAEPHELPSFESSHELDRRKYRDKKAALPPAPAGGSVGIAAQGEWGINGRPPPHHHRNNRGLPYQNGYRGGGGYNDDRDRSRYPSHHGPPPRQPPPIDPWDPAYNSRPPPHHQHQSRMPYHDRRDIALPPKPPPAVDTYNNRPPYNGPSRDRAPPLDRDRGPPLGKAPPEVDTYIPNYNAGPDRDRLPPPRRYDDENAADHGRPPPRRYDDEPPPQHTDRDRPLRRYDDDVEPERNRPPPRRYDDERDRDRGAPYPRRRSRSPRRDRDRDWDRSRVNEYGRR